jgi:hypothetical protein
VGGGPYSGVAASEPLNSKLGTPHQLENAAKTGQNGVWGSENKALHDATWQAAGLKLPRGSSTHVQYIQYHMPAGDRWQASSSAHKAAARRRRTPHPTCLGYTTGVAVPPKGSRCCLALLTAAGRCVGGVEGGQGGGRGSRVCMHPKTAAALRGVERVVGGMHEGGCCVVMCVVEALLPLPHCHLQHCKALPRSQKHGGVQQRAATAAALRHVASPAPPAAPPPPLLCRTAHLDAVPAATTLPAASLPPHTTPGSRAASREAGAAGSRGPTAAAGTRRHEAHACKPAQPGRSEGCSAACLVAPKCRPQQAGGWGQVLCAGGGPQEQQQQGGSAKLRARRGGRGRGTHSAHPPLHQLSRPGPPTAPTPAR